MRNKIRKWQINIYSKLYIISNDIFSNILIYRFELYVYSDSPVVMGIWHMARSTYVFE